jgi:hypothetical protein
LRSDIWDPAGFSALDLSTAIEKPSMKVRAFPPHRRGRTFARSVRWIALVAVASIAGCAGSDAPQRVTVYEVKGQVLLKDGRPLKGGRVYFVPSDGALTSEGAIGPDGTFSMLTGNSGEGAPPGEYKVRVEPADVSLLAAAAGRAATGKRLPFPRKYLDEDRSGLRVTIKPEANRLEPFRLR